MEPFIQEEDSSLLRIGQWEKQYPDLVAGFTTRMGGNSKSPFESFNCALHVGDYDQVVIENRKRLCEKLGFDFEEWTCAEQVHGNNVAVVEKSDAGKGKDSQLDAIAGTDGIITGEEGVLLTSFYADCVPLIFLIPGKRLIGIAHAGWKGTAANIAAQMVETLNVRFSVTPKDIEIAIGPSIGGCCYEVDEFVVKQLTRLVSEQDVKKFVEKSQNPNRFMVDLKTVNRILFIQAGLEPQKIHTTSWCTSCNTDLFYSYRKEAGKTGRMAAYIGWRKEV